ncbi:hypothetical protein V5O48_009610 [Marasmius crinis-equi]|uniref:Uncharacterized protein n=1 Tax=Marasmius crinis-equi TaxID=585013 RepID=A0ABR3FAP8_9AGAR
MDDPPGVATRSLPSNLDLAPDSEYTSNPHSAWCPTPTASEFSQEDWNAFIGSIDDMLASAGQYSGM